MKPLLFALVLAQSPEPAAPPAPTVTVEDSNDEAFQIGKLLRCPVCQGMPIAESPAPMAQDMMRRVRELVAQGKSREEILQYFERSYEGWVLLKPKAEGANLALWLLPPAGLLVALVLLARYLRRAGGPAAGAPAAAAVEDDYLRRVREEVSE